MSADYPTTPVPTDNQRSTILITVTSAAWIIAVTTLFTGGSLAENLSLTDSSIAIVIGLGLIFIIALLMGLLGAKYNISTAMLSRATFGEIGAKVLGAVLAITLGIGWFAWQVSFFSLTLYEMFPNSWWATQQISMIWAGSIMTLTALGGFKWLSRLSIVAVPLVIAVCAYGIFAATGATPNLNIDQQINDFTIYSGITAVVGSVIFGAVVLPDISRYSRSYVRGGLAVSLGYVLAGLLTMYAGAYMVSSVSVEAIGNTANIPAVMKSLGLGLWAFIVILFAQWTTNDSNLYSGSLGLSVVTGIRKEFLVIAMGITGVAIAWSGIQGLFVSFLILLGTFMPPVAGVLIADYYLINQPESDHRVLSFQENLSFRKFVPEPIVVVLLSGVIASTFSSAGGIFASPALFGFFLSAVLLVIVKYVKYYFK